MIRVASIPQKQNLQPVVFLDRDGTLNVERGYIHDLEKLELIDGAAQAVAKLNAANVAAVLVTNQTGAARGFYPETHIHALNDKLCTLLKNGSASLDAVYYCPHLEDADVAPFNVACNCRKPAVGMIEQAFNEHRQFDRSRAFVVGDKSTDVELARNAGIKGILVTTGYGDAVLKGEYQWPVEPDFQAHSIVEAVEWILDQLQFSQTASERSK
jgi:D-glycero-D-manno-heptose 1,7-bisphosphate phosphatase